MTNRSKHSMRASRAGGLARFRAGWMGWGARLVLCGTVAIAACQKPSLTPPEVLVSPYATGAGTPTWAVAPLANESGTSVADAAMVSDALVNKLAEVRGLSVMPLNRTLAVMRQMNMDAVRSPAEARALAAAMGADALVVGTITAYDPYDPPRLGLTLGLFRVDNRGGGGVDPVGLRSAASEPAARGSDGAQDTLVSDYADGANHEVLMDLQRYAEGRHDPGSALGWRRYSASMPHFAEFASHRAVGRLLDEERLRMARSRPVATYPTKP
jgi:hypothetical protein